MGSYCIDINSGKVLFANTVRQTADSEKLSADQVSEMFNPTESTTETSTQSTIADNTTQKSSSEYYANDTSNKITYIININSGKFHAINGPDTDDILPVNRVETTLSWDDLIKENYEPCGRCF